MMAAHLPDLAAQALALVSCAVIVCRVEPALNRMSRCTSLLINVALYLIFAAAVLAGVEIVAGAVPPWPAVLGAVGVALLLFCERRIRVFFRPVRRPDRGGRGDAAV